MPRTERDGLPRSAANRLLAVLPDDALALLEPDLRQLTLPQGVVCYGAGDPIDQVYFPHTGMISQLIATGDGDMVETSSIGREGAVGLQCGLGPRLSFTRTMVQIPGKFSTISAARFEHATSRSTALRDLIMRYTETVGGIAAERSLQRHSRRLVAIVPLAAPMRRPDRQRAAITDARIPCGNAGGAAHHRDLA